jgi:general stress protein YciG
MQKDAVSRVMREMGRKGGKARLKKMTSEQRSEIARKAAAASAKVRSKKATERAAGKKKA